MIKYQLVEKVQKELNKFKVTIKADSNDGDYITEIDHYTIEVFEKYVIDGLIHLKENATGNHKLGDYQNEYDLNIPYNGYDGQCHTLEELIVEYIDGNGKLWEVKF